MIKPTVGRVVWYYNSLTQEQPMAALIAFVHSDHCVNLAVSDSNGNFSGATSVPIFQDAGEEFPGCPYCVWMPYQKGQAAKTEALEKQIAEK